jgi:hypothetical protein
VGRRAEISAKWFSQLRFSTPNGGFDRLIGSVAVACPASALRHPAGLELRTKERALILFSGYMSAVRVPQRAP